MTNFYRFSFLLIAGLTGFNPIAGFSQCIPDSTIIEAGLAPADSILPCVQRGVPYRQTIYFKSLDQIPSEAVGLVPGFSLSIISIRLDSISNIPAGLSCACDNDSCYFSGSKPGCMEVWGETQASAGEYYLNFHVTATLDLNPDTTIISPLVIQVDSQFLNNIGLGYKLNVIEAGQFCPNTFMAGPLEVITATNPQICDGDTVQLIAFSNGGAPPYSYTWTPGVFLSDSTIANPRLYPDYPGNYTVFVTDSLGDTATGSLVINYSPLPVVTAWGDTTICLGDSVRIYSSGGNFYSWMPSTTLDSSHVANPLAFPQHSTVYHVLVSDSVCSGEDSVLVAVADTTKPGANFTFNVSGDTVFFVNTSNDAEWYGWDFGDNGTSFDENPMHIFSTSQQNIFNVRLIAWTICNSDTIIKTVDLNEILNNVSDHLRPELQVFPNPNSGNFYFSFDTRIAENFSLMICDPRGKQVFFREFNGRSASKFEIDLKFAAGIYTMEVRSPNFSSISKLIID